MIKIMSQVINHLWPFRFHTCIFLHVLKILIYITQCLMSSAGGSRSQVPWVGAPKTEVPRLWISVCSWHFSLWVICNEKKKYIISILVPGGAGLGWWAILLQPSSHSHPIPSCFSPTPTPILLFPTGKVTFGCCPVPLSSITSRVWYGPRFEKILFVLFTCGN